VSAHLIGPDVVLMPVAAVRPAPDNDRLYRPVSSGDPDVIALAQSIREHGVKEPLLVSADGWLLSGHRRRAAAELAGLEQVPVLVENVRRDTEPDRFLKLLRDCNLQRVKSFDEKAREAVIDADPEECRRELVEYRRQRSKVGHAPLSVSPGRPRKRITDAKRPFVEAIQRIVYSLRDFWPLTVRQVHYGLLNDPPLKHASKPDSAYKNDEPSYKSCDDLLTRMRLVDAAHWAYLPIDAIGDETRPVTLWDVHDDAGSFVRRELDGFLKSYARDYQRSQPHHVEVVVEKNTVASIVRPVCEEFCIPMTSGRGYSSLPPRADMAKRFNSSGKEKLVVVIVTDHDPDGEGIAESFARSLRDDFGVENVHALKAALTHEQVQSFTLPRNFKAKATSSRTPKYIQQNGEHVWELEALAPPTLQDVVRKCLLKVLDVDLLNQERQAEANEARDLHGLREAVRAAVLETRGAKP
jgi:hypothetical protein